MKSYLSIFLKGMIMGFAELIPGVSGGTIALILGIYKRLIKLILLILVLGAKGTHPIKRLQILVKINFG